MPFRLLPVGTARRDALRNWFFDRFPLVRPLPQQGKASGSQREWRARVHAGARAIGYVEHRVDSAPGAPQAMLVAFYLPQFHTIPENDAWWGKGFTEWRNVARALPQFEGHLQPRLPGDLGFYDLRNPQVLRDQAALARAYGIGAFCMYFYWFAGRALLELPHQQWLDDPSIEQPICLCWANENWTRTWDGRAQEVLIGQQHGPEDDLAFIAHIAPYLCDHRYLRVDGKPLLLVYRPAKLPDPRATAERWRVWCRENGVGEIFLAYVQSFERPDPHSIGFDAAVEFPPNLSTATDITGRQELLNPDYRGEALDWRDLAREFSARPMPESYRLFPAVNCGWDNEPRRAGAGRSYLHASPYRYSEWLRTTITSRLASVAAERRLVFVNAWNEWAEGAVLEPDARLGCAWLDATRAALAADAPAPAAQRPCVVVHAWYPEILDELLQELSATGMPHRLLVTTAPEKADAVKALLQARGTEAEIVVDENRGRDVLPFLRLACRLRREGEQVVVKLHTKSSPHRGDGSEWRKELLEQLVSGARLQRLFSAFMADPTLGIAVPDGHLLPLSFYWGANAGTVDYLTRRLGIAPANPETDVFASGSMFAVRLQAIAPLLDAHLDEWEFEPEAGQVDGTFAHAVERVFTLCARHEGFRVVAASAASGDAPPALPSHYPYAKRG
ncbi:glycoside hydrolase family 99-like domain-containing protein [Lysobacter terrae]